MPSRPMFDYVEGMWEAPEGTELERWNAVRVDTSKTPAGTVPVDV